MNAISKSALLITILAILYLLISKNLFSLSPFVIACQVLAVALSMWARRSFQARQFSIHAEPSEGNLLLTGPYRVIRHPMYASAMLLIWSSILGHLSIVNVVTGLVVTGVIIVRVVDEEKLLKARFPDYMEYSRKTKRIIPFVI